MTGRVLHLLGISLNVSDLNLACAFYRDALGFSILEEPPYPVWSHLLESGDHRIRSVHLGLGEQRLELVAVNPTGAPYPAGSSAADLWFQHFAIVTNDMLSAYTRLQAQGAIPISIGGPVRLPPSTGNVVAYKFRDPDGHPLELIHFPPGSGDAAWQDVGSQVTLGIDHTALSIANAARSLAFYETLGLQLKARQVNSGEAQERLDKLVDVAIDVIGLAPDLAPTPHIELLCYASPRGRATDPQRRPGDMADSRTILQVENLTGLIRNLAEIGIIVSPVSELPGGLQAASVRDPDGHALWLLETS